ncbi:MAG: SDR family oxidoreductase [bacterium]
MPKTVLITGGVSGIGREISKFFHDKGWLVTAQFHSSRDQAKSLKGNNLTTVQADLSSPSGCNQLIETYLEDFDNLNLLVNNAAIYRETASSDTPVNDWNEQMNLNARAPYQLSRRCAEDLLEKGSTIINLTDCSTDHPYPDHIPYFASKAALENITRSLARRLAPDVRVNAVAPGPIDFPSDYDEAERRSILDRTPLNRTGSSREVARTVHFLATGATYTTGSIIEVDGGKHIT